MNSVVLVGNIAGDMYSGTHDGRPFLRLLLLAGRPRFISGLRIVLVNGLAKDLYPALRRGSEIGVIGHLVTRKHKGSFVAEVEARNLALLRNFSWADVEAHGSVIAPDSGRAFLEGVILSQVHFEWRPRCPGGQPDPGDRVAVLRFELLRKKPPDPCPATILAYGPLAELLRPYLQEGSELAVDGALRPLAPGGWAVVVENAALLRNIDHPRAAAAQARCMQGWEADHQETSRAEAAS